MGFEKKKIIIFGTLIVFLASVVALFVFFRNDKPDAKIDPSAQIKKELEKREKEIVEATVKPQKEELKAVFYQPLTADKCSAKTGEEKTKCLNYLTADEAEQKKDYNYCLKIADSEIQYYCMMKFVRQDYDVSLCDKISSDYGRERCVGLVALMTKNEKLCKSEDRFEQEECEGRLKAYQLTATGDPAECAKIKVLEYSNLCFERMIDSYGRDCTKFANEADKIRCQDIVTYQTALDTENPKLCSLITDDTRRRVCDNFLTIGKNVDSDKDGISDNKELWFNTDPFRYDMDNDGLSDGDEMNIHHTDPTNRDTDGDGFSDGEEVSKGYNPKKSN